MAQICGEKNGEFPSKWDLVGGTIENAQFGDDNVIYFRRATSRQWIVPLISENPKDYLPDTFTVEFDVSKAPLRLESTGVINETVDLMKQNPELKFSVEGHTDSDGNAELNVYLKPALRPSWIKWLKWAFQKTTYNQDAMKPVNP